MAKKAGSKTIGDKPPRAHVEFEVFTNGAAKLLELPFVIGVMSDLAGQSKAAIPSLAKRNFEEIGENGIAPLFKKLRPRVQCRVPNRLLPRKEGEPEEELSVELEFDSMADFSPDQIARKVAPLKALLDERERYAELLTKLDGNEDAGKAINEILEKVRALK